MVPTKSARNEDGNLGPIQAFCSVMIFDIKYDEAMCEMRRIVKREKTNKI